MIIVDPHILEEPFADKDDPNVLHFVNESLVRLDPFHVVGETTLEDQERGIIEELRWRSLIPSGQSGLGCPMPANEQLQLEHNEYDDLVLFPGLGPYIYLNPDENDR